MTSTRSSRSARRSRRAVAAVLAGAATLLASAFAVPGAMAAPRAARPSAPAAVAAALPAAPQGPLSPSGCSRSGTTDSCELWAKTDTTSLLGSPMPIWGYATSAGGAATAPGPVLVVVEGDTVNVVLHNQLPQASALAFPGQPATSFSGVAPGSTVDGVPNGGTVSYSFTASEPGTFLYEAGHTPNGARQVAMGLAGALVVLPTNGTGAYGSSATAYNDESVLVLSEIDPALNTAANPATFDMRQFQARYRMINGKVFPSTDPVSTGVDRTVLLRYVNAGAVAHSMGLLGGAQLRIAQDGHPATMPTTSLVADLAPGTTMDTLVTMPSAGGSKLTLYEAGGHLDNNGMTEGDPTRIATGGMMTFLDTAAPPPTSDAVGPVPARLAVAPSPADGTAPVVVTGQLSDATTGNALIDGAELVVDDATSQQPGFGLAMSAVDGAFDQVTEQVTGTIPAGSSGDPTYCASNPVTLSCLSAGKHRIFVRGHDAAGNWGVISDITLNLPKTGPLTRDGTVTPDPTNGAGGVDVSATGDDSGAKGSINAAEWSLDTPAAPGAGTVMTVVSGTSIAAVTGHIPAAALTTLAEGTHHVFVRSHDNLGLWGSTLDIPFTVDKTGPTVNAAAVAPNPTNGKLSDPGNPGNLVVSANIIDSAGGLVTGAEGFIDPGASPAAGSGFKLVAVDGSFDSGSETVYGLIPLSQVTALSEGNHLVRVRGKDNAGNWGDLFTAPLAVDRVNPVLGPVTATPNPTNGATTVAITGNFTDASALNAAEIWLGTTDPGAGNGTPETLTVNTAGTQVTVTVAVPPFTVATRRVNVRIQDKAGNWSNAQSVVVTVRGSAPANTPAGLLGFNTGVGNLAISATAGMPAGAGNVGVVATAAANAPAYVSATAASPAHRLTSSFLINRHTLRTAVNGIVTLYDGRTSTGGGVFSIEMRTTSATAAQIRAVLTRSNGTTLVGNWFALNTANQRVNLTWVSGPALGTNRGQLQVTMGATVLMNQFANTTGRTLASVRLGAVDGTTPAARTGMTGSLYLDDYSATGVQ
jgi:hypothetical protein